MFVQLAVLIAKLNRNILHMLAESRLEEGRILLENRHWTGSYYLTGLAVECALKACLAKAVKEYDYPDKKFVNEMYQHKLQKLMELDVALWAGLQADINKDPALAANWSTVKDWDDEKRYDIVQEQISRSLFDAVVGARSGVMHWIRGRW